MFNKFDTDGNRTIDRSELGECMYSLGAHLTPADISEMFRFANMNDNEALSFREFLLCLAIGSVLQLFPLLRAYSRVDLRTLDDGLGGTSRSMADSVGDDEFSREVVSNSTNSSNGASSGGGLQQQQQPPPVLAVPVAASVASSAASSSTRPSSAPGSAAAMPECADSGGGGGGRGGGGSNRNTLKDAAAGGNSNAARLERGGSSSAGSSSREASGGGFGVSSSTREVALTDLEIKQEEHYALLKQSALYGRGQRLVKALRLVLEAYVLFDKDGSGTIDRGEVLAMLNEESTQGGISSGSSYVGRHAAGRSGNALLSKERWMELDWDGDGQVGSAGDWLV